MKYSRVAKHTLSLFLLTVFFDQVQAEEIPINSTQSQTTVPKIDEYPIQVTGPANAELGTPIELGLKSKQIAPSSEITVGQRQKDTYNGGSSETVKITRESNGISYVTVTPSVLGEAILDVNVDSADGKSMGMGDTKIFIGLPKTPPISFKVSPFRRLYVDLDDDEPILVLMPSATFNGVPKRLLIPINFLTFTIAPGGDASVLNISKSGLIRGAKVGEVTLEAHMGAAVDKVDVVVRHRQP